MIFSLLWLSSSFCFWNQFRSGQDISFSQFSSNQGSFTSKNWKEWVYPNRNIKVINCCGCMSQKFPKRRKQLFTWETSTYGKWHFQKSHKWNVRYNICKHFIHNTPCYARWFVTQNHMGSHEWKRAIPVILVQNYSRRVSWSVKLQRLIVSTGAFKLSKWIQFQQKRAFVPQCFVSHINLRSRNTK